MRNSCPSSALIDKHRRAAQLPAAETGEGLVRLVKREKLRFRSHRHPGRQGQELLAIAAREVGDGTKDALLPEKVVRERRNITHMDAAADDGAALGRGAQGSRNQAADGSENDRGVQ